MKQNRNWTLGLAAALVMALGFSTQAAIYDWNLTGPGDNGNWTTAANWTYFCCGADLGYPQAIWDTARIDTANANNYTVTVNTFVSNQANKLGGLTLQNTGGGTANLVVTGSGSVAGHDIGVGNGGHIQVTGAGANFEKAQSLSFFGDNGTFTVENGATFFGANSTFGVYIGGNLYGSTAGDMNSLTVTGAGTTYQANAGAHQTRVGQSTASDASIGNSATLSNGATWLGNVTVGTGTGASLNTFTASDVTFTGKPFVGNGGNDNTASFSDGVVGTFGYGGNLFVGNGAGADDNELNLGAAGGAPSTFTGQYDDYVGFNGAKGNTLTLTNATWTRAGNYWGMRIGSGAGSDNNSIVINDGGVWDGGVFDSITVGESGANGNKLQVNAGGQIIRLISLRVGVGGTGNSLIVNGTGTVALGAGAPGWIGPKLEVTAGNTLQIGIDGASAGQVNVTGAVIIGGSLAIDVISAPTQASYIVVANDGTDPVNGTVAEQCVSSGGYTFEVVYNGGDGNDVELILADCAAYEDDFLAALCTRFATATPTSDQEAAAVILEVAQQIVTDNNLSNCCITHFLSLVP